MTRLALNTLLKQFKLKVQRKHLTEFKTYYNPFDPDWYDTDLIVKPFHKIKNLLFISGVKNK